MTMCSQCHKRVAVVFMTRVENGEKTTRGLCMKCAKELGVPIDNIVGNVIDQLGISPEQLENAENDLGEMLGQALKPSDCDDPEDGGAPAIDFPKLFRDAGLVPPEAPKPADGAPAADKVKSDRKREKEQKKQQKRKPAEKNVSASDAAGTSMVPVSKGKRFLKKVVYPAAAIIAGAAIVFCVYTTLANRSAPIGFQYPTTLQRSDGTTVSTSYVHGDSVQVIQVTDDILPGTQFSKDNLAVATIPADVYNCAVAIGSKLCNVDMASTVVGKYATEYIGAGQILRIDQFSVNSTGGTSVAVNPWLAADEEDVRDYLWETDTSFLMFGREAVITINRTVDDNNPALREELYADDPTIEYTISDKDEHNRRHETIKLNAVVSDLLNADGTLLFDVYAKLGAILQGELTQYVKNHVSIAKMVPSIVRFRMTEKAATVYDAAMVTGADATLTSGTVTTVELLEELEANTPERAAQLNICQFVDRVLCGDTAPQNTNPVQ